MYFAYKAIKKHRAKKRQEAEAALAAEQGQHKVLSNSSDVTAPSGEAPLKSSTATDEIQPVPPPTQTVTELKEKDSETQQSKAEKKAARIYSLRLIAGLFLPFSLQALDTTIIASALPFIASDFQKVDQLNWIISAFSLCSAVFIPAWGQLADILGRHTILQTAIILTLIGSALCTGAPEDVYPVLLLGRAFQGMGCAGIIVLTKVILADKVSLETNAKNNSYFSLVAGISYAVGPTVGGYLTETSWRWCFGINLPIAVVGLVMVFLVLRPVLLGPQPLPELRDVAAAADHQPSVWTRLSTIDFGGQLLFLFGAGLVILAFTWAGSTYAWDSAEVLAPLCIGVTLFAGFILWEYLMSPTRYLALKFPRQRPMISWSLISNRNAGLLMYINFATGLAMYAVFYFCDIYFTVVKGYGASKAGIQLLYYTPGLGVGVYGAIFLCNVFPGRTWYPLFAGTIIEAVGMTVLTYALHNGGTSLIYGMMGLAGCGTGLRLMPGTLHGVAFFSRNIASIVSVMSLALPLGGTVGMTIMSTVFNNKLDSYSENAISISTTTSFSNIDSLTPEQQDIERDSAKKAIVWAFISILPLCWIGVVAALGLGNARIKNRGPPVFYEDGTRDFRQDIYEGVYVLKWLRHRRGNSGWKKSVRDAERAPGRF